MFGAVPPRGFLQRLARRLGVQLAVGNRYWNYADKRAFKLEIARLRKWYEPGRKIIMRRRTAKKRQSDPDYESGLASSCSDSVAKLFQGLDCSRDSTKFDGYWAWRRVALLMHASSVAVHSGAVPVERMWSNLADFFPQSARIMGHQWFMLLSRLAFLRFNFRHFRSGKLPTWSERDALLAERLENVSDLMQRLSADASLDAVVGLLFQGFQRALTDDYVGGADVDLAAPEDVVQGSS